MANEIIVQGEETRGNALPVTQADVETLQRQRAMLSEFVRSQLVEADFSDKAKAANRYGDGDYGVIPGTKKRCLFKQGAEKFQKLFGLGVKFDLVDRELDRTGNFAMFTYKAQVYSLRNPGVIIAECIGSANSQETKYKTRTVWKTVKRGGRDVRESVNEETPVVDILNTLQKMAQKRAMIGATILATGASEYFTQDVLEPEDVAESGSSPKGPAGAEPQQAGGSKQEASGETGPSGEPPVCCGKPMMVSKYADKETGQIPWYCVKCTKKVPRAAA